MSRIVELKIEPDKIYVCSIFELRVKIEDSYMNKKYLSSENGEILITENGLKIQKEGND
ncbi:MAG: hypothetical protein J6K45_04820 [Clostridia bacterium]|nr:hypothetical protein [Clostridia bacterium]